MKSYLRFLSRNKLYTAIEVVGLSLALAFVIVLSSYIVNDMSVNRVLKDTDDIPPASQLCQKGDVLLSHHRSHSLALHQLQQCQLIFSAGCLQIANLIDGDPLPCRAHTPRQGRHTERQKSIRARSHSVLDSGQTGIKNPHLYRRARGVFFQINRLPRPGPCGHSGADFRKKLRQQRSLAAASVPRQDQMALTAAPERTPNTVCC